MNPRVLYRAATYATDARAAADSVISALTPAAWYRNATGVTESGGFASQWDDYSGNARHLVQGVGTNQPAYSAGVLTFDGADNYMVASSWGLVQPETIYIVVRQDGWTADDTIFDGTVLNSARFLQSTASPNLYIFAGDTGINTNPDLAISVWGIFAVVVNNASSSVRLNDNAAVTGTTGSANMNGFRIGGNGGVDGRYSQSSFKEVIVFAASHDAATQSSVITALNNALTVF